MKKAKKSPKKSAPTGGEKQFMLRISDKDKKALKKAARKYADGNLSAWLRIAGREYVPKTKKSKAA